MTLYYTDKEQQEITSAENAVLSTIYMPTIYDKQAFKIAAIRFQIGVAQVRPTDKGVTARRQVILAKLCADYPDKARMYMVTLDIGPFLTIQPVKRLLSRYMSNGRGPGQWGNTQHESIMQALYAASGRSGPAVIHPDALRAFIIAYHQQEQASKEKNEGARDIDLHLMARDMAERQQLAAEGKGVCYRCSAVKPRRSVCAICGWIPKSMEM